MTTARCSCPTTDTYRQLDPACQVHGAEAERRRRMCTVSGTVLPTIGNIAREAQAHAGDDRQRQVSYLLGVCDGLRAADQRGTADLRDEILALCRNLTFRSENSTETVRDA